MEKASRHMVVPGDRIGHVTEHVSGPGTYVRADHVYAAIVGKKAVRSGGADGLPVLTVAQAWAAPVVVPSVGSTVTCRVTRINASVANVDILCVGDRAVKDSFAGQIRKENVRSFEIDKVKMEQCFRPGDVLLAEVISLGDRRSYFLSTAAKDKGVVYSLGEAGQPLLPVSTTEMQCPVTRVKFPKKVPELVEE